MALKSDNPKGRHWERTALPVIGTITPGEYSNPNITVDEYGRITSIDVGGVGDGVDIKNEGVAVSGGPFTSINLIGGKVTASDGGSFEIDVTFSEAGTISVLEEGSVVAGGPFSSLNFIGANITATDAGSGQLDVTVVGVPNVVRFVKANTGVAASQNVGSPIDATSIVRSVAVTVTTAYDAGATLEVQDGAANVLLASAKINPQLVGTYMVELPGNDAAIADPQVVLVVGGAPATGLSVVEVVYELP